jgi:hypothetical protein
MGHRYLLVLSIRNPIEVLCDAWVGSKNVPDAIETKLINRAVGKSR